MVRAHPHYNPFNIKEPSETPNWRQVFGNDNPIDLEIGFSNGTWLVSYAQKFPQRNIVGVEIRTKFIEVARERIAEAELKNAYVLQANANNALGKLFKPGQLNNVYVMHPDPWYKKKHLKRRVVNAAFIKLLAEYMAVGAELHVATDKEDLAQDMLFDLEAESSFENVCGKNNYAEKNIEGVRSDIEIYHQKQDNPIYRMIFRRR